MTAYEDVVDWASEIPWWQQRILARIDAGEVLDERDYEEIARELVDEEFDPSQSDEEFDPSQSNGWLPEYAGRKEIIDESVRLVAVRYLKNVNRLAPNQELTFEPDGLTVIFGNNGSGKSGYARVIRSMVRARYRTEILPNVFDEDSGPQSGQVVFMVGTAEREAQLGQQPDRDLARVAFYDARCGDTYLTSEAKISYRPRAVQLLEELASVCSGVRRVIDKWRREVRSPGLLPQVNAQSAGAKFLNELSADTGIDEIKTVTLCPADITEQLEKQADNVVQIRASNPGSEKRRLSEEADAFKILSDHLDMLNQQVGEKAQTELEKLVEQLTTAQKASDLASCGTFADEPLPEVGSDVWKALWRAAESYSKLVYPDHEFPHTGEGAVCVLCQQPLGVDATDRFERFQRFVIDAAALKLDESQRQINSFYECLEEVNFEPPDVSRAIVTLKQDKEFDQGSFSMILEALKERKSALFKGEKSESVDVMTTVTSLREKAELRRQRADNLDVEGFKKLLGEAEAEEQRLRDQIAMRDGRDLIEQEVARLRRAAALEKKYPETSTRSITDKVAQLTRAYVTKEVSECFVREAARFGIEQVAFTTRGHEGVLLHKPVFVNARKDSKLENVLSEGEQTALGFAGFLTEAHFDISKSALVFDDPVSSLDHMNRELVAEAIVELARDRQVIVFTHDIAFTACLYKAAGELKVPFGTRGVERRRKMGPGYTTDHHPWSAKNAGQRINTLRQEIARLREIEEGMQQSEYLREVESIAGHMSQTWERIISQVIAEPLVDYRSLEVRVRNLRLVGRITEADVENYDNSYSRISKWASRHDPHPELNYVAPTVDELSAEIDVMADWLKRLKKYQS
ncbi:AAA family ATPase [Actinotignum sanguinis]|uniref:AAA family ATPase n=3 Tax=Actinomycetaceae TaxID=2049 RepID=A0ABZ0RCL7_9ACTO|nr:AAA family ATPase [Actinotignum sanguinis]WPJ88694.1 AAA family ATPase [Schaalia turicensis]MDE1566398.1 AAA family ATPase [Actinotignum sanguinis]MDE1576940.1 AAA family ATPase [Actinotignum sanguinis]MDE1641983.1 AAA family ATPase [Actinotignum sanguinis]MDE1656743.1 AAA family ATPase [Actinotignum sanguinis]